MWISHAEVHCEIRSTEHGTGRHCFPRCTVDVDRKVQFRSLLAAMSREKMAQMNAVTDGVVVQLLYMGSTSSPETKKTQNWTECGRINSIDQKQLLR